MTPAAWHDRPASEALTGLDSSRQGLAQAEAERRLARHGANRLPPPRRRGPLQRFLLQFHNVLIYVLLAAGAVTVLLGHWLDSGVIFGVVVINAFVGFVQEGKAEHALEAIRKMLSPAALVLRDGQRHSLPAEQLVPGDIVFLASGDRVPADLRLIDVKGLKIEEAALTGESLPVEKQAAAVPGNAELGDRASMAWSGTLVTYGQGTGVVTATGAATEIGRISTLLAEVQTLSTPLLRQMSGFSQWLTWVILAIAGLAFGFGILVRDYAVGDMFIAAVGLAVAAIPEGLPAVMTITLAIGVQRMARRRAIVRRLPAVEALGAVTVICTDKTGTLTRNEMTVQRLLTAGHSYDVSGVGYAPHGGFSLADKDAPVAEHPELLDVARAGLLCNDAVLHRSGDDWQLAGDPTEGALVTLAMKAGLEAAFELEALPRVDIIPFESQHRFMATLHHDHAGHALIYLKGAPESVLELCRWQREAGEARPLDLAAWQPRLSAAANAGMRLLALAVREQAAPSTGLNFADVEAGGFTLLAIAGLADPPREESAAAVAACRAAGIRVAMITGDHADTARAIARQIGLSDAPQALTGADLEAMDDARLHEAVAHIDVFARASPEHKLRLVNALQARGEVVAMTGDGINDAPALKRADVGVAMGHKGTEAAKEAAEMVLADDHFATIAAAVEEGRTIYDNLKKAIVFILPTNGGEAAILLAAILLGLTLPITPVQILWVNMVTAVTLALALAFEPAEADIMRRPPRAPAEPLLSGFLVWRTVFVSLLLVAGGLGLFLWETDHGASLAVARSAAVNALVMGEIVYLFNCRRLTAPTCNRAGLAGTPPIWITTVTLLVLQGLFTYLPVMQKLFGVAGLPAASWGRIVLFGLAMYWVVELEKAWLSRQAKSTV
ncbi:cation-transporting P-type ATPase [Parasulfuritortus cantonensis]|uniref:Cation-transporting P-type ATPase n=1 Tax=Parasulfuritortus cantonensis TaxID=2528202 RepID=A0A4R1BGS6_9PROT|nr:cation-transporting P-type ATPase [Parasulfuritortus cantonensis]TCJ16367.1 cation-transporting P-type ATPase [Parasulfuritortus cantonensis]